MWEIEYYIAANGRIPVQVPDYLFPYFREGIYSAAWICEENTENFQA